MTQASPEDANLFLGVGATYAVGKHFRLIGDWIRYELDIANSEVISLGFQYGFGG